MARVALFGGSFNPPHVAHCLVALYALQTQPVDEVWFVPVYKHVFGKDLASFDQRVRMCELATDGIANVRVSRVEQQLARRPSFQGSRTFDLLRYLQQKTKNSYRLLIGSDILGETAKWYRWDDVATMAKPIVVGRPGFPHPSDDTVPMPQISSTEVRELLATRAPRAGTLLPKAVLRYIDANGLYR